MTEAAHDSGVHELPAPLYAAVELTPETLHQVRMLFRAEFDATCLSPADPTLFAKAAEDSLAANSMLRFFEHDDLPPLEGKHFVSRVNGEIYELTRQTRDRQALAMMLRDKGFVGNVEAHVQALDCEVPAIQLSDLQQQAAYVVELWKRRRLVEALRRVDGLMCIDALDFNGAVQLLRERILEVRG